MKLKYLILLSVTGAIISLDQLTKHFILSRFQLGESVSIFTEFFSITYVRNPGAAFGLFARWEPYLRIPFFIAVPLLVLVAIGYLFRKLDEKDVGLAFALSLVIGGAVGNLIDRIAYNYVVDFIDFHWGATGPHFPAFNIADSMICLGVGFLIFDLFRKEKRNLQNAS